MSEHLSSRLQAALPGETWHGTVGGYSNHHCSCADCREIWSAYVMVNRARRRSRLTRGVADVEHGSPSTYYNHGCRDGCPGNDAGVTCRQAASAQRVALDRRKREAAEHG